MKNKDIENRLPQQILSELASIKEIVAEMHGDFSISRISYFENLPESAIVGADYVAYKYGISEAAVVRGRFGTEKIPRYRKKPVAFQKKQVDAAFRESIRSTSETAAMLRNKTRK